MKFEFYLVSKQLNKAGKLIINTELPISKKRIKRMLCSSTTYRIQEHVVTPVNAEKVFNSLGEALEFVSKVKLTGTTKVCEYITERKKLMSFYGDAPFEVSHSMYHGCDYTFFTGICSRNRDYSISTYDNIIELFSEYYYVGMSKFNNPFVPANIVLEKVGNITHVYEETGYYDWVEKEIIAKY